VSVVSVLENPGPFDYLFCFQVQFECREVLPHKLEWKIIYMASAESEKYDQVFDSVLHPPLKPDFSQLHRNILFSNPHVICFHINWGGPADQMEDIGNVDPESKGRMPANCTPGKGRTPPSASCLRTPQHGIWGMLRPRQGSPRT
uniref:Anti-silencing function 1B histone chaperone n=1 Tax=Terrapene triunguis TaxID=2587831 RepID=A0A674JRR3_9SAUR